MMKHSAAVLGVLMCASFSSGAVVKVPETHKTIPAAIDAASAGDTILIAPGTYMIEDALVVPKELTIASNYINSNDTVDIDKTVIKGGPKAKKGWFTMDRGTDGAKVIGLTFAGNRTHTFVINRSYVEVRHCKFLKGKDQLSIEFGGGVIAHCYFEGSGDDAIDCDYSSDWIIEHNVIKNASEDGIEVRLQPKLKFQQDPPSSKHIVRYNTIVGSGQSGIQFVDYEGDSQRRFEVYGNVFAKCKGSGVSCMVKEGSKENYRGSDMVEKVIVYNNTFDGCNYGMTMAPKVVILNNIFSNCKAKGIGKGVYIDPDKDELIVDYCLFFKNGLNYDENLNTGKNIFTFDPEYGDTASYKLSPKSQAVNKGVATYEWKGVEVLKIPDSQYSGNAPDLGGIESGELEQ